MFPVQKKKSTLRVHTSCGSKEQQSIKINRTVYACHCKVKILAATARLQITFKRKKGHVTVAGGFDCLSYGDAYK